jgi:hypothetical protein
VIALIPWTQREFNFNQPLGVFPAIVERVRGAPARSSEIIAGVPEEILTDRINGKWAAKEHLGHWSISMRSTARDYRSECTWWTGSGS